MQLAGIAAAFAALTWAYVTSDYSLENVALNSHSSKPLVYKISGFWGGQEGTFLLWALLIALIGLPVLARPGRERPPVAVAYLLTQLIFSFAVVRILKIVFGRARPGHGAEFTFFSTHFDYNSFPSGHSADAFVSGVFLYYLLKNSKYASGRFWPLIYAFAIALSRVFISSHYPSDVAAGMAIGIMGAWFFITRLANQAH